MRSSRILLVAVIFQTVLFWNLAIIEMKQGLEGPSPIAWVLFASIMFGWFVVLSEGFSGILKYVSRRDPESYES